MHPIQITANQSINQKIYLTIFMNTNHTQQKLISRWALGKHTLHIIEAIWCSQKVTHFQ